MAQILTEEQAKERLNSSRNLVSRFGKDAESKVTITPYADYGRKTGISHPFTEDQKVDIAVRRGLGEKLQVIAEDYGTSKSTIHQIEVGRRVNVNRAKVNDLMEEVQDVALIKLMASLGLITDDKLGKLGARELANFAASMSKVIGNVKGGDEDSSKVQIHLYAPELRSEVSFKTIEIRGA